MKINVHYIRKALLINRILFMILHTHYFKSKFLSIRNYYIDFFFRTCVLLFSYHSCNVLVVVPHYHPSLRSQSYLINWEQNVGPVEISQVLKLKINPLSQSPVLLLSELSHYFPSLPILLIHPLKRELVSRMKRERKYFLLHLLPFHKEC